MVDIAVEELTTFLVGANKVDRDVAQMVTQICKSVSDFAGLYREDEFENGLSEFLQKAPYSSDPIKSRLQLARLRIAWQAARQYARRRTPEDGDSSLDLEAPLDNEVRKAAEKSFTDAYGGFAVPIEAQPAASLFNRHFREFRRRNKQLDDLTKIRSLSETALVAPRQRRHELSPGLALVENETVTDERHFQDVLSLILAHEIMCYSWSMAGTQLRESGIDKGNQVREADLSTMLAYHSFSRAALRRIQSSEQQSMAWFLHRDRACRTAAMGLYNPAGTSPGLPWAEALRMAWEQKTAVLWQCSDNAFASPFADAALMETSSPRPTKQARHERPPSTPPRGGKGKQIDPSTGESLDIGKICTAFNSSKGCARKQKDCPHSKLHRCSKKLADGTTCAAWQHSAPNCNR
jgi:hypothetical protein